jgi:hypothetical protein
VGTVLGDGLGRLVHAVLAEDGLDHRIGALTQLAKRVGRVGWQGDGVGPYGWLVEGDDWRCDRVEVIPQRGRERCDLTFADLVGESDALHGQVNPPSRDQIEAAEPGECGLVVKDELLHGGLVFEGEVAGVEMASWCPAWPPPPVVADGRDVLDLGWFHQDGPPRLLRRRRERRAFRVLVGSRTRR